MDDNILEVKDLKVHFESGHGTIKAVDGVSFSVRRGSCFGLVGESGSGKTLSALSVLNILPPQARIKGGGILFNGLDLLAVDDETMRGLRGSKISMVFQEPASAMNPVFTAGEQMVEAVLSHRQVSKRTAKEIAVEYFKKAHIADPLRVFHDYPHRLSGGMRQRVMIAMALVNSPELVILDEPTTALDVTIQARILGLLAEIISGERLSALFISHDFGIVENMCDDVAVMRGGRIVEKGPAGQILKAPQDPYTVSLLEAVKALS